MQDGLGSRMKEQYEERWRFFLPRRTYTIVRVDGKAFHSYTRSFKRPFDSDLIHVMDRTAVSLCEEIQGAKIGYVQSDEISVLVTDFETTQTAAWFNGNLQKIVSVASSVATAAFNKAMHQTGRRGILEPATFDARAFIIPDREEVFNYFIWRQKDATRNSLQQVAQSLYTPAQLHGKNSVALHQMIYEAGKNWDDYTTREKQGSAIVKASVSGGCETPARSHWIAESETPIFTQVRSYLGDKVPVPGYKEKLLESVDPTPSGSGC